MSATTSQTLLELAALITGLVMLGEAKLLFVGVRLAKLAKNPWFTPRNRILLGLDILFGFVMLAFVFLSESTAVSILFWIVVCFSFLAHGYREWEYFTQRENRFCAGIPQFIVNNIKLIGLLFILFAILS
jgi:hypothetical protein